MLSCEKKPFDYLNMYLGTYDITYYKYSVWANGTNEHDTTVTYVGKIEYGPKSAIRLQYPNGDMVEIEVSKNGVMRVCGQDLGSITKTHFELSYDDNLCVPGPIGAISETTISGVKH